MFKDSDHAWNPTAEEIRIWAYSDALIPEQDWELAVNSFENIPMICSFVDDEECKHISFFLSCLYVFTGDFVRSRKNEEYNDLIELLNSIEVIAKSEELKDWIKRSKDLILNPDKYDYRFWGLGSEYVY
ncbi:hypothetical protein KB559_07925 [Paenibacillus sp. Marseille-P2973]|uniref:hypothetical protein n=1 Tax=Paenibacillus sp. Marseille-P2973 TaxID=1871032 RepID=UPI001B3986E1|nr:hypothetical protein [Paenibacillus sp. Marseille-P2973]MBQ4898762.1 hypothetical protein [Paenibacillus sp. Marseille-P2973]